MNPDPMHFNREEALAAWRNDLLGRGGLGPTEVDELQDHLTDIEDELLVHLPQDEAFLLATHRLGAPQQLTREFGKVSPNQGWLLRAQWVTIGIAAYYILFPTVQWLLSLVAVLFTYVPGGMRSAAIINLYMPEASLAVTALLLILIVRRFGLDPLDVEQFIGFEGVSNRNLLIFVLIGMVAWRLLLGMLSGFSFAQLAALSGVPGEPSVLQSGLWFQLKSISSILVPACLLMGAILLQRRRQLQNPG